MNCVIIEDEPRAIEVIERYIVKLDFLQLLNSFREPLPAIDFINHEQVDLLFLDINLPDINGLQFFNSLTHKPYVIFTTAYPEYAIESYEVNAVDYLLKPISFERFLKSVTKVQNLINKPSSSSIGSSVIFIKSGGQTHRIHLAEILFLEKDGNYLTICLKDRKILVRENMADIFKLVPETEFVRIHKSFVISIRHLEMIEQHQVTVGKVKIPLGPSYREAFLKRISLTNQ